METTLFNQKVQLF